MGRARSRPGSHDEFLGPYGRAEAFAMPLGRIGASVPGALFAILNSD